MILDEKWSHFLALVTKGVIGCYESFGGKPNLGTFCISVIIERI